jgi:FKBP-type peptidyl-prolyl cis-trans isomerase FkpA
MLRFSTIYFLFVAMALAGCNRAPETREAPDAATLREALAETNKILLSSEDQEIRDFIDRYGWDEMQETGSGLRYWIYERGDGPRARSGHRVVIRYEIHLLTGDLVYSSQSDGPREFRIGRGGVESGLEEGILLMHEGDRAKFILPAHLAHGVPGDGVKIPKRAAIVYDVEILELK